MLASDQRDRFKADVEAMKLRTGNARRDAVVVWVGLVLMLGGAGVTFLFYEVSLHQSDPRNIASEQILALGFVALTVVGAALFLYASLARFLRMWLLRQLYEGQAHVDQIVSALRPER